MGIQKTNLNEEKIKELLKENYDIKVLNVEEINRGTANIFKLESLEEKYLLKEFNEKRTLESIEKEIDIINFLKNKGISVPKYISTIKQEFYIKNEDRIIILQEYVDGYTMENNTGDYDKVIESAEILGKVTKALLDYPEMSEENIIEKNFSKENTINKIQKMKELILNLNDDNKYRERFKEKLEFLLDENVEATSSNKLFPGHMVFKSYKLGSTTLYMIPSNNNIDGKNHFSGCFYLLVYYNDLMASDTIDLWTFNY